MWRTFKRVSSARASSFVAKAALAIVGFLCAPASIAAVNLGPLPESTVATFSYGAGPLDLVYNFGLKTAANLKIVEADYTLAGGLGAALLVVAAPPDATPPTTQTPDVLGLALELLVRVNAQIDEATRKLAHDRAIGDEIAAGLDMIAIKDLQDKKALQIQLITEILKAPPWHPLMSFASLGSALAENTQEKDVALGAGSYSLILSGIASGRGGGSLSLNLHDLAGSGVPKVGTWIMMLSGFGLVGAAMRRRQVAVAARTRQDGSRSPLVAA